VESEPGTTYGRLLTAMRATIRDNGGELGIPGPIGTFFRRVITFSCAQVHFTVVENRWKQTCIATPDFIPG
jgi:hypothetical protein